MSTRALFEATFAIAAPFWALMIVLPRWSVTGRIVRSPWIAALPLAVYTVLVLPDIGRLWAVVTSPDLAELQAFVAAPVGAATVWAHLISFDLFVGRWMFLDSRERGVPHLLLAPILVLTILLSPFGLLAYLLTRTIAGARGRKSAPAPPARSHP